MILWLIPAGGEQPSAEQMCSPGPSIALWTVGLSVPHFSQLPQGLLAQVEVSLPWTIVTEQPAPAARSDALSCVCSTCKLSVQS